MTSTNTNTHTHTHGKHDGKDDDDDEERKKSENPLEPLKNAEPKRRKVTNTHTNDEIFLRERRHNCEENLKKRKKIL